MGVPKVDKKFSSKQLLAVLILGVTAWAYSLLPSPAGTGTPTKHTTFKNAVTIEGAFVASGATTLSGAITNSGVNTMTGANVITHAPTGLKIQDSDATHLVTIAPGNESANRTLSIPVLGGADTVMTLGTAQTVTGVKTMSGANLITHAPTGLILQDSDATHAVTLAAGNESGNRTLSIPVLGGADTLMTLGTAQTVTGVKTMSGANIITHAPTGLVVQDSDATHAVTIAAGNESGNRTLSIPVLGGADTVSTLGTAQSFTGVKTFTADPVMTRYATFAIPLSPNTGAAADATTYAGAVCPGRACTITKITFSCIVAPTDGTDVLVAKKNGAAGNTLLNAANLDANTLVANTGTATTLTATGADLVLTATDTAYFSYAAGTQTVDAQGITAVLEVKYDAF